jgi:hypothetical protein
MPPKLIEHETSSVTLEALRATEKTEARREDRPTVLPQTDLQVANQVFQWRLFDSELGAEESHIKELVRVLEASEQPLDPILVTAIGARFYVVDGHHRLLAYRTADWKPSVPVEHYEGTVEEARAEALRLNIKNKLPMTKQDKFEAAWRLVKEGNQRYSKSRIVQMTTVSDGTVATMRRILKDYPLSKDVSWREAQRHQWGQEQVRHTYDEWAQEMAKKMAKQIAHNVGPNLTMRPDITALALEMLHPDLPKELIREWYTEACEVIEEEANGLDI